MTSTTTSVLGALGYQVLSQELGVYVLQLSDSPDDARVVALMLVAAQPSGVNQRLPVKLFLEPVPDGVAAVDVVELWQVLDARRFEETGLEPVQLELGPVNEQDVTQRSLARPDGAGTRFVLVLPTGDLACFN